MLIHLVCILWHHLFRAREENSESSSQRGVLSFLNTFLVYNETRMENMKAPCCTFFIHSFFIHSLFFILYSLFFVLQLCLFRRWPFSAFSEEVVLYTSILVYIILYNRCNNNEEYASSFFEQNLLPAFLSPFHY